MGTIIDLGLAPSHDPMFGISSNNIVSRLTPKNWRRKAVGLTKEGRFLYVMVQLGRKKIDGKKQKRHYVQVHLGLPEDRSLNADFDNLTDALAYANGADGSALSSSTQAASPDQTSRAFIQGRYDSDTELLTSTDYKSFRISRRLSAASSLEIRPWSSSFFSSLRRSSRFPGC